jgi:hypothetical protein
MAPQLDPQRLRDLNHSERRVALYLLVAAVLPEGLCVTSAKGNGSASLISSIIRKCSGAW